QLSVREAPDGSDAEERPKVPADRLRRVGSHAVPSLPPQHRPESISLLPGQDLFHTFFSGELPRAIRFSQKNQQPLERIRPARLQLSDVGWLSEAEWGRFPSGSCRPDDGGLFSRGGLTMIESALTRTRRRVGLGLSVLLVSWVLWGLTPGVP